MNAISRSPMLAGASATALSPAMLMARVSSITSPGDCDASTLREANALIALAATQRPTNMADCIALLVAAHSGIYQAVVNDVRPGQDFADEVQRLTGDPLVAIERVAKFLAAELGISEQTLGGNYSMNIVEMRP